MNVKPFLPSDRLEHEKTSALADLQWMAKLKRYAAKTCHDDAVSWGIANRAPERAMRQLRTKAAISAGSMTSSTLGTEGVAIGPFSDAMRMASAFFRIKSDNGFTPLPLQARVSMVTTSPTAGVVAEGAAIPLSRIVLSNTQLVPIKVVSMIAMTDELLLAVDADGQALFSRELQSVVGAGVDAAFVASITSGVTAITSVSPNKDLRAAALAINRANIARPYFIVSEDVGVFASTLANAAAGPAFAAAGMAGGLLCGVPMLVSSGLANGTLVAIDAVGIAAGGESVTIDVSSQADALMDTAPPMNSTSPTAAQMVSAFQTNMVLAKCVAVVGFTKIRSSAVAQVTGITTTTWTT